VKSNRVQFLSIGDLGHLLQILDVLVFQRSASERSQELCERISYDLTNLSDKIMIEGLRLMGVRSCTTGDLTLSAEGEEIAAGVWLGVV
jgi:hypothetical protein